MKLKLSTLRNFIVAVLLLALGGVAGFRYANTGTLPLGVKLPFLDEQINQPSVLTNLVGNPEPPSDKQVNFDVFWEVWHLLERDYLEPDKLNAEDMVNGAVAGMTSSLDDPYTIYMAPQDNKRNEENLSGSFYGIGIELGYIEKTLAVVAPIDGMPAAQAGLEAGDLILHVKDEKKGLDEDTADWSLTEAVNKIRGEKGQPITLTIYREGDAEPQDITVKRDEILIDTVKLEFKEHNGKRVAHAKVSRFGGRTKEEWDKAVAEILAQKDSIAGIVLDFRNNPGGYFDRSIELASDFIENGVVVSQKGKYSKVDYDAIGKARLKNIPLIVLVNKGSASASEIVAGALRDDLGVKLVGQKTFGKGTVQDHRIVSNGGGLNVTIGRWLLPEGDWIHDEGIPVDIEVKPDRDTEEDEVLIRAIEEL